MNRRIAATALWFYVGWIVGGLLASALGFNAVLGPVIGVAVVVLVVLGSRSPAANRW